MKCPECKNEAKFRVTFHAYAFNNVDYSKDGLQWEPCMEHLDADTDKWPHKVACIECEHSDVPEKFRWDPGKPTNELRCPECEYEGMFHTYWTGRADLIFKNGPDPDDVTDVYDTESIQEAICGACEHEVGFGAFRLEWQRIHAPAEYEENMKE